MGSANKKLKKLTAEIFNDPACPEWARYAAVDRNGKGYMYSYKPILGKTIWGCIDGNEHYIGEYDASEWEKSLVERPVTEEEATIKEKVKRLIDNLSADMETTDWGKWMKSAESSPAADEAAPEHDDVTAPEYYVNTPFGMELKKITCHYNFNCGSALKYIIRHGKKLYNGMTAKESAVKDLSKAIECLRNEIEFILENW